MKINIGIMGGAGYTGGELLRILLNHPFAHIAFVHSKSQAGQPVHSIHTDLLGDTDLTFTGDAIQSMIAVVPPADQMVDVLFLCSGHGESAKFMADHNISDNIIVIDLSTDFRDESEDFVYGLPELQRNRIKEASRIANPGCFATSIQLALLPLANAGLLTDAVHISAVTGSTGAGQSLSPTTHFSWRNNNLSIYKAFTHQHLSEIRQSLTMLQPNFAQPVNFVPYRGDFTRGIMANVYTAYAGNLTDAKALYADYYASHPFTHLSDAPIDIKQVVNTNKCLLHLELHDDQRGAAQRDAAQRDAAQRDAAQRDAAQRGAAQLLITSVIDNLTKGASGQAVQNMNLLFGLPEDTGLRLKAVAF